jgi:hypothetical protein
MRDLLRQRVYRHARRIHLVVDNLDTHFRRCFEARTPLPYVYDRLHVRPNP